MLSIVKGREFSAGFEKALRARGIIHRRVMVDWRSPVRAAKVERLWI